MQMGIKDPIGHEITIRREYWLQGYAFTVNVSAWIFGVAGVTALQIAILTGSSQALPAALQNPVKSLKTE